MIYLLISLPLLLLGASGHSISKLEINNTNTDVYEIKEDSSSNTIAFVNPKTEQQTLREIVYYHLIEKPYGQSEDSPNLIPEEGPDFDDTARPFTNGHGFPFLASAEQGTNDDFDTEDLKPSLAASQESVKETPLLIDEGEEEVIYYYDEDIEEKSSDANKGLATTQVLEKPGEKAEIRTIATTTTEPHIEEQSALPDVSRAKPLQVNELFIPADYQKTDKIDMACTDDEAITATPPVAEDLETKARLARKFLFESAKERYNNNDNTQFKSPTSVRRKREISKHIPEGPRLGPLNLDSLPPYLRNLISTEEPQPRSRNYAPDSSEEERMEEIHRKMKDMMSKSRKEKKESQPAPRTYGMNLTEDHGYVWNNINPESGFHFTVEASGSIEADETSEEKEIPTKDDNGNQEESEESTEPENSLEEKHKNESKSVENNTEEEDDVKPKESAIEADPDKSQEKYEEDKYKPINVDNEEVKDLTSKEEDASFEEKGRKRKPPKEKEDTIDDLLESEQFWSWLTDWTSAYLDVLTEHIEEAVQAEVENQMKSYEKSHKKKNKKPVKETEKPKPDDQHSQKDNQTTTEHTKDENTTKIETKIEKEQKPATNQTLDNQKEEDLSQKQKEGDTQKSDANNNEGKVVPSKDPTKEEKTPTIKKDPKESTKIQAENLYGNSVGSEQVTNIFIFYPNKDINKIVEDIKNNTDSLTNVFEPQNIDKRINVPDKNEEDAVENSSKAPAERIDITTNASIATETPMVDDDDSSTSNTIDVTTKAPEETTEHPSSSKMPVTAVKEQNQSEITSTTEAIKIETSHESNEETEVDNPDVDSDTNTDEGSIEKDNSTIEKNENDNKDNTDSDNASGNEQTTPKTEDEKSLTIEASENEDASNKSDSKENIETSTEPA